MNFIDAAKTCLLEKYVDFNGRARRSEYWYYTLFQAIVVYAIMGICLAIGGIEWISTLVSLAFILPSLAVSVRRLHDIGKSGWWLFIAFIPFVGGIYLLYLTCKDSEFGENEYGPNPKGLNGDSSEF